MADTISETGISETGISETGISESTSETPERLLTEQQLHDALALASKSDSVELKLTIPQAEHRFVARALGIDPLGAQIRQVYFFDTPDLALNEAGVVARARRVQDRNDDSVVKLRPVVPDDLPKRFRKSPNLVVEVDAMPGGFVCSGSMKGALGRTDMKQVADGKRKISKLFSKEQRAFYEANAPDGLSLDDLSILGPILVLKLNFSPGGYKRKLVAELWLYPDYSAILELSTKCAPPQTEVVAATTRKFLEKRGVDLTGEQQTKTKTALEFFAGRAKLA